MRRTHAQRLDRAFRANEAFTALRLIVIVVLGYCLYLAYKHHGHFSPVLGRWTLYALGAVIVTHLAVNVTAGRVKHHWTRAGDANFAGSLLPNSSRRQRQRMASLRNRR